MTDSLQEACEISDNYEHLDDTLEYVLENVLSEESRNALSAEESVERQIMEENYNSVLLNQCECVCVDTPIKNCGIDTGCCHGGNYHPDAQTAELVLRAGKPTDLIYECGALCKCNWGDSSHRCRNRLVQIGPRNHLQIVDSAVYRSKGLITNAAIPKGAFICEYAGELLTRDEARRRHAWNTLNKLMNYILCLNEIKMSAEDSLPPPDGRHSTFVDPSRRGNIGRYLNHSCNPNCVIYSVRVDCPIPKIAIFSNRHIFAGEELCFHYGGSGGAAETGVIGLNAAEKININNSPCLCGAKNCEKFLPNIDFN